MMKPTFIKTICLYAYRYDSALTVNGILEGWTLQVHGTLVANDADVDVLNLHVSGSGAVGLNDTWLTTDYYSFDRELLDRFTFNGNSVVDLRRTVGDLVEVRNALWEVDEPDNVLVTIQTRRNNPTTLTQDLTLPTVSARILINSPIIIAQGVTLTNDNNLQLRRGIDLLINGTLVNNGYPDGTLMDVNGGNVRNIAFDLRDGSTITLGETGEYRGAGAIFGKLPNNGTDILAYMPGFNRNDFVTTQFVDSNPYCWLVPTADFVTPANTQRIESEAFVGIAAEVIRIDGEALEVYSKAFADCRNLRLIIIPETVKSVADDALTNCKYLTVYGGTEAKRFAEANGYAYAKSG